MSENRKKALSGSHEVQKFIRFVMIMINATMYSALNFSKEMLMKQKAG